jgi:hypothetical protein
VTKVRNDSKGPPTNGPPGVSFSVHWIE